MLETHSAESGAQSALEAELGNKHCIFQSGESFNAISATSVREVTHAPTLVPVPRCPAAMAGLCHLRSEFIPVVYLAPLLGERDADSKSADQLLVLSSNIGPWALVIDRVIAIDALETHVDADHRSEGQRTPLLGTATYRSNVVRVLDPQVLHQIIQQSRHQQWAPTRSLDSVQAETLA